MKIRYSFNKNIEDPHKREITRYIRKYEWLVPRWCHALHFNMWSKPSDDEMISINILYEYREACVDFTAGWLNQTQVHKETQIIHELCHLHLGPLADFAKKKINILCPSSDAERFNASLQDDLRKQHEACTEDLADVIYRFAQKNI